MSEPVKSNVEVRASSISEGSDAGLKSGGLTEKAQSLSSGKEALSINDSFDEGELYTSGPQIGFSEHDAAYLDHHVKKITLEEARLILIRCLEVHKRDRNFTEELKHAIQALLDGRITRGLDFEAVDIDEAIKIQAVKIKYHSPYSDVRAVTDALDQDVFCETFRSYVLGTIWVIVGTGVNQFFEPRQPSLTIPPSLFQLLILPCGWFWARFFPDIGFTFRGKRHSLNPGPWTYKEQILATIMFNVTSSLAYANTQIFVQKMEMYYNQQWAGAGYQILFTLSTQFMGFGIAGLLRNVLVYPVENLWMKNFPILALNRSLMQPQGDKEENINGWTLSRYKFFGIVFAGCFLWSWVPEVLMKFLKYFNWMTWIAPNNFNLAAITGTEDGLGVNPIPTFDLSVINYATPLVTPFFATANLCVGAIIAACVLIPAVLYTNLYNSAYIPVNSSKLWTNKATTFDVNKVLTNNEFDEAKYKAYSPPFYSAANVIVYGTYFANYTAIITRSLLYDWRVMAQGFYQLGLALIGRGKTIQDFHDAQSNSMKKYKESPVWWFLVVLVASMALGIGCVEGYKETHTPVWSLFFAVGLGMVFLIPGGMLMAQTNQQLSLNVLAELVAGYAITGNGTAMMIVKAYGYNVNSQALQFISDLKLGHYAKIPPRATFRAQCWATLISALTVVGVANWQMSNIENLCVKKLSDGTTNPFWCPDESVYFSSSIAFGVIGPRRMFDYLYPGLKWTFLIGAALPVPLWAIHTQLPKLLDWKFPQYKAMESEKELIEKTAPWWHRYLTKLSTLVGYIDPVIMMAGTHHYFAPNNLSYILPGFYISWTFMKYIRTRYTLWFEKYHYVLAAAVPAGVALSLVIIFFSLQYHPKSLKWWGNTISAAGLDGNSATLYKVSGNETFGPSVWS